MFLFPFSHYTYIYIVVKERRRRHFRPAALMPYRGGMHANVYNPGQDHRSQPCKVNRRVVTLNPKPPTREKWGGGAFLVSTLSSRAEKLKYIISTGLDRVSGFEEVIYGQVAVPWAVEMLPMPVASKLPAGWRISA